MSKTVTMVLKVEFQVESDAAANASITRIQSTLKTSIEYGHAGGVPTGVVHGSAKVAVVEKNIT